MVARGGVENVGVGLANVGALCCVEEMDGTVRGLKENWVLIRLAFVTVDEFGGGPLRGPLREARDNDSDIRISLPRSGEPDTEDIAVF